MSKRRRRHRRRKHPSGDCCLLEALFEGPCFVATAAYEGNAAAEPVRTLRRYRDQRLARHRAGRAFTRAYYRFGPYGARVLQRHPWLKAPTRVALTPVVAYARRRVKRSR